ncbi:hypothetical protein GCM10008934_34460 [Virgibacillus salarius]
MFKAEPLPIDHSFWEEENITITPHISGLSEQYVTRSLEIFLQNLDTYISGEYDFINKVDVRRGY